MVKITLQAVIDAIKNTQGEKGSTVHRIARYLKRLLRVPHGNTCILMSCINHVVNNGVKEGLIKRNGEYYTLTSPMKMKLRLRKPGRCGSVRPKDSVFDCGSSRDKPIIFSGTSSLAGKATSLNGNEELDCCTCLCQPSCLCHFWHSHQMCDNLPPSNSTDFNKQTNPMPKQKRPGNRKTEMRATRTGRNKSTNTTRNRKVTGNKQGTTTKMKNSCNRKRKEVNNKKTKKKKSKRRCCRRFKTCEGCGQVMEESSGDSRTSVDSRN